MKKWNLVFILFSIAVNIFAQEVVNNSLKRINKNDQFFLIDKNAKWLKKSQDDKIAYLNYKAYKEDLERHEEESKTFKKLGEYTTNLSFNSPRYELSLIEKDSILGQKRTVWHKNLAKDAYVEEGLRVLAELKIKDALQMVKNYNHLILIQEA